MIFVKRCKQLLESLQVDAVVIQSQPNMYYFSGFTGDSGSLLIGKGFQILLTDFRYTEQATVQAPNYEIIEFARGSHYTLLANAMKEHGCQSVGFEEQTLLYEAVLALRKLKVEWEPVSDAINALRIIKSEDELECMKRAGAITDKAFLHILTVIHEGISEIDIALELEFFMRKNGAENISFAPIVASGENGSLPHAIPSARKIQNGDMITLDFGCRVSGYCSDMTRTIGFGSLASEQKNVYNVCLEAQLRAIAAAQTMQWAKDLDGVARSYIAEHGFGDCFCHGLGHGVGLDIHELPVVSPIGTQQLQENMVFSIEPGIYLAGQYGVRIEDFGVLTQTGYQSFVQSQKELICL